jgi:hypothetical protein
MGLQAENLARLALCMDFQGPATNLAVGREMLAGDASIDNDLKGLTAERALNGSGNFHKRNLKCLEWAPGASSFETSCSRDP